MKSILITGAAQSGKSTVVNSIARALSINGFSVVVLHETATELLKAGFDPRQDRLLFQKKLFELQRSRESVYRSYINSLKYKDHVLLLLDRGMLDGGCYVSQTDFINILSAYKETMEMIMSSYDLVIQLQSSALIQQVSKQNNRFRLETVPEECQLQEILLRDIYSKHPNYHYVLSDENINNKLNATLTIIKDFCI